jgi:hypothetical protein
MEGATRSDTYEVSVSIAGINFGVWDQLEGGDVDSEELTYRPGGMKDPVSLGGSRTVENFTIRRLYRLGRDHIESDRLIQWVGKAQVVAVKQPLDIDANAWGKPITYRGILKRVSFPDHNSESNDAGLLELECTTDGIPTGMPRP